MAGRHSAPGRFSKGGVRQLSNLSIDEVSLVDRGANQHAVLEIAKRHTADEVFDEIDALEDIEKMSGTKVATNVLGMAHRVGDASTGTKILASTAAGGVTGEAIGRKLEQHANPYDRKKSKFKKNADEIWAEALEEADVQKRGGAASNKNPKKAGAKEEYSGDDPAGVTRDQSTPDEGDIGPDGKISGVEVIEGEDSGTGTANSTTTGTNTRPGKKGKVGKSAGFWENFVSKVLDEESATEDLDEYTIEKHFPGAGAANPMQSPFPGAAGMGQPPTMQTVGAQGTPMGQPTPPPMGAQPPGGMPGAAPAMPGMAPQSGMGNLPPEVVQYIQQLEQQVQQLQGGEDTGSEDGSTDPSSSSESKSDDNSKKNPFGKSGDYEMSDTTFLSELAKSLDDEDQRETFSKALEAVSKAEQRAAAAEEIAKSERDLRLEREFIGKAADFNVPVNPETLGPVLKRMSETLDVEDLAVIVKCLRSASAQSDSLFHEVGKRGGGSNGSVLDEVEQAAQEYVEKGLSHEAAVAGVFDLNPRAYDEYLSSRQTR